MVHTLHHLRSFLTTSVFAPGCQAGADVFNALDLMENKLFLEDLKFGTGDGNLHYYFYNWKCPEIPPEKVSLKLQTFL